MSKKEIARIIENYFCQPAALRAAKHLHGLGVKSERLCGLGWSELVMDCERGAVYNTLRDLERGKE